MVDEVRWNWRPDAKRWAVYPAGHNFQQLEEAPFTVRLDLAGRYGMNPLEALCLQWRYQHTYCSSVFVKRLTGMLVAKYQAHSHHFPTVCQRDEWHAHGEVTMHVLQTGYLELAQSSVRQVSEKCGRKYFYHFWSIIPGILLCKVAEPMHAMPLSAP